jgi:hypothetical protein
MKIFFWDEEKTMRSFFLTLSWAKKKILWVYLCEKKRFFSMGVNAIFTAISQCSLSIKNKIKFLFKFRHD